jgi:four helix bundle protein
MSGRDEREEWAYGPGGYRDLVAWQQAMELADALYDATDRWPPQENHRLVDQIRRAAISVPSNIAEGQGRGSPGEFSRFLTIAYGSLCELETQLYLAHRRRFLDRHQLDGLIRQSTRVGGLIRGLLKSIRPRSPGTIREDDADYILEPDDIPDDS